MEHFVIRDREERYHAIRKEQRHQYYYMASREEYLRPFEMVMFEQIGKRSDHHQQEFADQDHFFQKPYYYPQSHVVHHERGPSLHPSTAVVHQQPYVAYKEPNYVETRIVPKGLSITQYHQGDQTYPHANELSTSQTPQVIKKQGAVIDCNEAAKLYNGVVFTEYGRNNKFPF
ncbi:hypothetical protein PanWU01x14_141480 [Parasponia andersonii]|uniref:Uncharacterized protein n=1 Tax=Parasponia andersonii TaxID=3476 RepID=A0A2P5CLQ1_PARAD|nr:hypothetical protein PanWU01x14_141480 [Parasponia andersonii]